MHNILIVDDDVAVTNYLMVFLMQNEIFEPTVLNESRDVPDLLEKMEFDTIVLDMDMPNMSGLDILAIMHERGMNTPVIVLSGVNDVELAVKALKLGAFDYVTKPVDDEALLELVNKAIEHRDMHDSISQLPQELSRNDLINVEAFEKLVTQDPDMIHRFHEVEKLASGDACLLFVGELGTGKSTVARATHSVSSRRGGPFVMVNLAEVEADEVPVVFFGHAAGFRGDEAEQAGLVDEADGGTLYVINIQALDTAMQHRIDRLIRTGEFYREGTTRRQEVDLRLLASARSDFALEAENSGFSENLLYNLLGNTIYLLPLRERVDDIPLLAEHFLKQEVARTKSMVTGFDDELIALLKGHPFPGNQDELRDIVVAAVERETGTVLGVRSLSHYLRDKISGQTTGHFNLRPLDEVIRAHASQTFEYFNGDHETAARALVITVARLKDILA